MGRFTQLTNQELMTFFDALSGDEQMLSAQPVEAGMENTTFLIKSVSGKCYYFTLFEQIDVGKVAVYLKLLGDLHKNGLPVPVPMSLNSGSSFGLYQVGRENTEPGDRYEEQEGGQPVAAKPWIICPEIPGKAPEVLSLRTCQAVGDFLGLLHQSAQVRVNGLAELPWVSVCQSLEEVKSYLPAEECRWCDSIVHRLDRLKSQTTIFPLAVGHGDLFPDNTLFEGDTLNGVIDFFNAYYGPRVFDLSVAINAWCSEVTGALNASRLMALLSAYQDHVELSESESDYLCEWLVLAALRFWASRWLWRFKYSDSGIVLKDPSEYRRIVENRLGEAGVVEKALKQSI